MIKACGFIQTFGEACIYKKVSGSSIAFLILYVDDILLIGNDIEFLDSIKGYLNKSFSMKDLGEAAYILGIKIFRDRSRHLIGLSQSTYLDKVLKKFKMDQSKKGFLHVLQGVKLSKTQNPTTTEDRERMKVIPYATVIGSIKVCHAMDQTYYILCPGLAREYNSDLGVDHWTVIKIILRELRKHFLGYGGDKEFVIKSYVDASFDTDLDDSQSQSIYILKSGSN